MKQYNFFEDKNLSLSKITDETSYSTFRERSTFLQGPLCKNAKTTHTFLFLAKAPLDEIGVFYVTVTHRKFKHLYCGFDSTAFCLLRTEMELEIGVRYIVYGKVSKIKTFFIDCMNVERLVYKEMCYMLL